MKVELTKNKPPEGRTVNPSECFELRAAALYRDQYTSAVPKEGQAALLTAGQLRAAAESVHAALRRGAIRLVDARAELAVLKAALEVSVIGPVPVKIGEPYKIREPRKPGSTSKRKKSRKKAKGR
jgi:hypothetical protein